MARRTHRGTRAVVIGGGIAGIAAASALAERGVHVVLLEREAFGGRAGGFAQTLVTGERMQIERGFHGFFRQYYNLRALLNRVDPGLHKLAPLSEYPVFGSGGVHQTFRNGGRVAPAARVQVGAAQRHTCACSTYCTSTARRRSKCCASTRIARIASSTA